MSKLQIYIDEDAMDCDLAAALRSRGVTVITVLDTGLVGKSDAEQLTFFYRARLCSLHVQRRRFRSEWVNAGRTHGGILLAPQQRFLVGEQLRRILRIRAAKTTGSRVDRIEFLGSWG